MLGLKDLAASAAEHTADLDAEVRPFDIAGQVAFPSTQPAIMGVINLSADSWYRQSICTSVEAAVERGSELQAQGAAIIDIGAESTLRQAQRVSADEQRQRLLPVIEQLASRGHRLRRNLQCRGGQGLPRGGCQGSEPHRHGGQRSDLPPGC